MTQLKNNKYSIMSCNVHLKKKEEAKLVNLYLVCMNKYIITVCFSQWLLLIGATRR